MKEDMVYIEVLEKGKEEKGVFSIEEAKKKLKKKEWEKLNKDWFLINFRINAYFI